MKFFALLVMMSSIASTSLFTQGIHAYGRLPNALIKITNNGHSLHRKLTHQGVSLLDVTTVFGAHMLLGMRIRDNSLSNPQS